MRPVLQTRFGAPHGNCAATCYALMLEVPLSEFPDPQWPADVPWKEGKDGTLTKRGERERVKRWQEFQDYLAGFGLRSIRLTCDGSLFIPGYAIGAVVNPRSVNHAVVCYNGNVVWDPNPAQDSYDATVLDLEVFILRDPALAKI